MRILNGGNVIGLLVLLWILCYTALCIRPVDQWIFHVLALLSVALGVFTVLFLFLLFYSVIRKRKTSSWWLAISFVVIFSSVSYSLVVQRWIENESLGKGYYQQWWREHSIAELPLPINFDPNDTYSMSSVELEFVSKLDDLLAKADWHMYFQLDEPAYLWMQVGPLLHVFRQACFVYTGDGDRSYSERLDEYYVFAPNFRLEFLSRTSICARLSSKPLRNFLFTLITRGESLAPKGSIVTLTHGVDEDQVWFTENSSSTLQPSEDALPTLVYSRFAHHQFTLALRATGKSLLEIFQLDRSKPTLLIAPTHAFCLNPHYKYEDVTRPACGLLLDPLMDLDPLFSNGWQIVYRPHPVNYRTWHDFRFLYELSKRYPQLKFDTPTHAIPYLHWLDVVDVLAAGLGGVLSASMMYSSLPVVVMRWPELRDRYSEHRNIVINSSMAAELLYYSDHRVLSFAEIVLQEYDNRENETVWDQRKRFRNAYHRTVFGEMDGYEEYRICLWLLKKYMSAEHREDVAQLERLYNQFPQRHKDLFLTWKELR